jgi:hypothetical protein
MSGKSDADNHSNQLNPNNDAYYSSRGTSRDGGDDDDDAYQGESNWRYRYELKRQEILAANEAERARLMRDEFTLDFMCMNGRTAHLKFSAELPYYCEKFGYQRLHKHS